MRQMLMFIGVAALLLSMMIAARQGSELLNFFVDGPDETTCFFTALANHDKTEFRQRISRKTANLRDENGLPALCCAARFGDVEQMSLLLQYGADLYGTSTEGFTPLMYAARLNHVSACQFLLERGVDPSIREPGNGRTALDMAIICGAEEAEALLRTYGVTAISSIAGH